MQHTLDSLFTEIDDCDKELAEKESRSHIEDGFEDKNCSV